MLCVVKGTHKMEPSGVALTAVAHYIVCTGAMLVRPLTDYSSGRPKYTQYVNTPKDMQDYILKYSYPEEWVSCDLGYGTEPSGTKPRIVDKRLRDCTKAKTGWPWIQPELTRSSVFGNQAFAHVLSSAGISPTGLEFPHEFQELIRYDIGGHFVAHCDRTLGPGHLGTLLLVMPDEDLEGGTLITKCIEVHKPRSWEALPAPTHTEVDPTKIQEAVSCTGSYLVYIPLNVVHSVTPVTAGGRLVAKAAVFGVLESDLPADPLRQRDSYPSYPED